MAFLMQRWLANGSYSELQEALRHERQMSVDKDEKIAAQACEIDKFAEVLVTLEQQQASMAGMDEDRLASIEAMFSELHQEKEKTQKLVLAVAEHKRQTTLVESAKEKEASHSRALEEQILQLEARIAKGSEDSTSQSIEAEKLQQELLATNTTLGNAESELSVFQRQLHDIEEQNQMMINKSEEKEMKMLELKFELAQEKSSAQDAFLEQNAMHAFADAQNMQLQSKEAQLDAIQDLVKEKEGALGKCQRTITHQEVRIQELRNQVFSLEQQNSSLKNRTSSESMQKLHDARARALEKEREVCNLQQQLAEELEKRQTMQYEMIQHEKQTLDAQGEILYHQSPGSAASQFSRNPPLSRTPPLSHSSPYSASMCGSMRSVCGESPHNQLPDCDLNIPTSGASIHVCPGQSARPTHSQVSDHTVRLAVLEDGVFPDTAMVYQAPPIILVAGTPQTNASAGRSLLPPTISPNSPKISSMVRGRAYFQPGISTMERVQSPEIAHSNAMSARLAMASRTWT